MTRDNYGGDPEESRGGQNFPGEHATRTPKLDPLLSEILDSPLDSLEDVSTFDNVLPGQAFLCLSSESKQPRQ